MSRKHGDIYGTSICNSIAAPQRNVQALRKTGSESNCCQTWLELFSDPNCCDAVCGFHLGLHCGTPPPGPIMNTCGEVSRIGLRHVRVALYHRHPRRHRSSREYRGRQRQLWRAREPDSWVDCCSSGRCQCHSAERGPRSHPGDCVRPLRRCCRTTRRQRHLRRVARVPASTCPKFLSSCCISLWWPSQCRSNRR